MNIIQNFYDNLATEYDKLFFDWQAATHHQAVILDRIFHDYGFDSKASVLDCACGIGTQAIGLATLGYKVTASDISDNEIEEAKKRSVENKVDITFRHADFRSLSDVFNEKFDIIISMDNALPHMLTKEDLETAVKSITNQLSDGGIFVASIRDYDELLLTKPPYSPPYIHKTDKGQRVSFQTWEWNDDLYKLIQYIIDDNEITEISKFECIYRATKRAELTNLLLTRDCIKAEWKFPEETGYYQPIVIAEKKSIL